MTNNAPPAGRYHLLHTISGRPAQHGWWGNEKVAREKFRDCVGLHGRPGARVTLTDEETGAQLAGWPDDSPDVVSGAS